MVPRRGLELDVKLMILLIVSDWPVFLSTEFAPSTSRLRPTFAGPAVGKSNLPDAVRRRSRYSAFHDATARPTQLDDLRLSKRSLSALDDVIFR
jgi:hypothetical protein